MKYDLQKLIFTPKYFDRALVVATRQGEEALLEALLCLQLCEVDAPQRWARVGWLLFLLDRDDEARELLRNTPGMLARGYLARVENAFCKTTEDMERHLEELLAIERDGSSDLSDIEGIVHLDAATARLMVSLNRGNDAPPFFQSGIQHAKLLKMLSIPPMLMYQQGSMLFRSQEFEACCALLAPVSTSPDATAFLLDAVGELLVWSSLLGGVVLPDGVAPWVKHAHDVLSRGASLGRIQNTEFADVCGAFAAMQALLTHTVKKFPVERGPRSLEMQQFLLRALMRFEENPRANPYRNFFIHSLQVLGLALCRDGRTVEAAQGLCERDSEGLVVLDCWRMFVLLQASAYLQQELFAVREAVGLQTASQLLSSRQKDLLASWVWEFCPDVPFMLSGYVNLYRPSRPLVVFGEDGVHVDGQEVQGYPVFPLMRYVQSKATDNDITKLKAAAPLIRGGYRMHIEWSAKTIQNAYLRMISVLDDGEGVR